MKKSPLHAMLAGFAMAIIAATSGAVISGTAMAQTESAGPVILIVDQARLVANSKAGKSINEQLSQLQIMANAELQQQVEVLVKEQEELKAKQGQIPEDQFLEQAKRLAVAQNNIPMIREIKVRELALSEQRAIQLITNEMRPILKDIVDQRGASILLDRSAVMYASEASDITDEVLKRLDEKIQTVKVERIRLTGNQQPAAPAGN